MTRSVGPAVRGVLYGYLADLAFGDPTRWHPVAGFGTVAAEWEERSYADDKLAGALHVTTLLGGLTVCSALATRAARGHWSALLLAAAVWTSLGGTSLVRTGDQLADFLEAEDLEAARALLPSLCGRDPQLLDADGLARAGLESVAENTSDAQVAALWWAGVGGVPAVLGYRGANTLDAMIGHRSERYRQFGWAAARLDDVLNYLPARIAGLLVVCCAPLVGGSPVAAARAWRRDARLHPSPNAGVVEASFAGALGVQLGGLTRYPYGDQLRPTLGDGPPPTATDLRRAVRLSRWVQAGAVLVAVALAQRRRP